MYMKTQALSMPVGHELAAFAVVMEAKLQMEGYDRAETWKDIPLAKLIAQLELKAKRLGAADQLNKAEIFSRAVALGNLAMMVAEVACLENEKLSPTQTPVVQDDSKGVSNANKSDANATGKTTKAKASSPQRVILPRTNRHTPLRRTALEEEGTKWEKGQRHPPLALLPAYFW